MKSEAEILRAQRFRDIEEWKLAAERLGDLDALAPKAAWLSLEHYVGLSLRGALTAATNRLRAFAQQLEAKLRALPPGREYELKDDIVEIRNAFQRTETTLDFYADALATRANPRMAALLKACDHIANRAMAECLTPMGRQVPAALTYLDKGLGASILKAGIRLWDPAVENPVAAIKAVRHNLLRPTALIHEAGHQIAHMLGWNEELAVGIREALKGESREVAETWASWASEIAGDAYAFVHTGYAAVLALRAVVAGSSQAVFQMLPGDPHPVSWLRVLLGTAMCRRAFGGGPWDELEIAWVADYPEQGAPADVRRLYADSRKALPAIVEAALYRPYLAFGNRPLTTIINVARVSPAALHALQAERGRTMFSSQHVLWDEAVRLLALTGLCSTTRGVDSAMKDQEQLMLRLGTQQVAA